MIILIFVGQSLYLFEMKLEFHFIDGDMIRFILNGVVLNKTADLTIRAPYIDINSGRSSDVNSCVSGAHRHFKLTDGQIFECLGVDAAYNSIIYFAIVTVIDSLYARVAIHSFPHERLERYFKRLRVHLAHPNIPELILSYLMIR